MKGVLTSAHAARHVVSGRIFNSGDDPVTGIGTASVLLRADGAAEIHYQVRITTPGTSTSLFAFGLNRDLLRNLDAAIPVITPVSGGTLAYYTSDGKLDTESMQYAGTHEARVQFWEPARIYTTDGAAGGWPTSKMTTGMSLEGVCYGTYE